MTRSFLLIPRFSCFLLTAQFLFAWTSLVGAVPATLDLPSLAAHWDATGLADLENVLSLPDLSGNGWDLSFGGTLPTHVVNQFGRSALGFGEGLTSPLMTTSQILGQVQGQSSTLFDQGSQPKPWALAFGFQYQGTRHSQALGEIAGASNNQLAVRLINDEVDFQVLFPEGPPALGIQNLPISPGSNVVLVVRHDGVQQSVEVLTDESSWGSGVLGNSVPFRRKTVPLSNSPGGNFVLNASQTPMNFYGAAYLQDPTLGEIDELKAWGAHQWLLQGRDQVVLFEGDSTVEVDNAFTDRAPSWAKVLHEQHFDATRVLSQNFANGGDRAIVNEQFKNGLANSPAAETWDFVVDWFSSAGAEVYAPIVMGTNDIGGDNATPAEVIAALETWAQRTADHGGEPLWVGILDTQGDATGEGRTAVNEGIRSRFLAGENAFLQSLDALREDSLWGWQNDVNLTAPAFMADNTHPNTAGNVDIANKLATRFFSLLAAPGDFNFDSLVDGNDLTDPTFGWQARFGLDLLGEDFLTWQRHFSASSSLHSTVSEIPEPNSLLLVLLFVGAFEAYFRF